MNNQKRPSSWLPVRLTSVKTSPSLSAEKLHLQQRSYGKHRAAERGDWFHAAGFHPMQPELLFNFLKMLKINMQMCFT